MIKRDTLMDSIKFILMFLVVYGHVMQEHIEGCNLNASIYTFIYTFHMPLFVLISGYFTNTNKKTGEYFKKIFQFLVVYLLFATIRGIIKGELSLVFLIRPGGTLWYLVSLIWFRIFIWFFRRYNIYTLLTVSFLAALIGGYVGTDILAFQRTVNFLPYFLIGYMIRQNGYTLNHLSSVSGGG